MRRIEELDHIEELVRDSLRARAEDVEPTPALWQEVEARVARRRRGVVLSWSLAGAAAVLAAVAVAPALIGALTGPDPLEIAPLDDLPPVAVGVVPSHAVVVDAAGDGSLLDLASGDRAFAGGGLPEGVAGRPVDVAVRAGSTPSRLTHAVAAAGPEGGYVVASTLGGGTSESGTFWPTPAPDDLGLSVVGSGDGDHLAFLVPTEQDDGAVLHVHAFAPDLQAGTVNGEVAVVLEGGARLLDWVGPTRADGDVSHLWVLRPDGTLAALQLRREGDTFVEVGTDVLRQEYPVLDAADARSGGTAYFLEDRGGYLGLVWSPDGGASDTTVLHLGELLGLGVGAEVWLDGRQDGVLVGDGDRLWLLAHDGAGGFAEPVEVGTGVARAALLDAAPTADPEPDGDAPPSAEDGPVESDEVTEEAADAESLPPTPLVVADGAELRLVTPAGVRTLVTLPEEGHSVFLAAAVRPGSTLDDLTIASLTTAEGMFDLRWTRVVDGEVEVAWEPFEGPYAPDHDGIVSRPVWSPDGASVAWLEQGAGTTPALRVVGWDEGPGTGRPADDNAAFALDWRDGAILLPQEWVPSVGSTDGMTEIRAVLDDPTAGWYAIPLQRQADGAWAQPGYSLTGEPGPMGVPGLTVAIAAGADGGLGWMVRLTDDGPVAVRDPYGAAELLPLPDELLAGEGLPTVWARPAEGGLVVGSPNTAAAWYVRSDGDPLRLIGPMPDADVVR